jgi:FHA domain
VYRSQPCFPSKRLARLVIILTSLAAVEAGLSSSGFHLPPKLGLLPMLAFAARSTAATTSPPTEQVGFFGRLWCTLRGNPDSCRSPKPTDRTNHVPPDMESQRRDRLRKLQTQHDREPNLSKKVEYDRQLISLLDPYVDYEKIRALQSEIQLHEKETVQLVKEREKQQLIGWIGKLLAEKKYTEAEWEAEKAIQIFDDAQVQQLLNDAKIRRLVEEAKDSLAARDVDKAYEQNGRAVQLDPNDIEAQKIQTDIDHLLSKRKTLLVLKIVLIVLLIAVPLAGLYVLLRPRKWVLEGIDGACKEEVFPLDAEEVKIGALGPPHGECDIVIRDVRRKISQVHCSIVRNGRHFYLMDESASGTLINDEEVEKGSMRRLRKGDRLSLADEAVFVLRPN